MYILASQSPRRKDILKAAGLTFMTIPSTFDESLVPFHDIISYVETLAYEKAKSILDKYPEATVIGADTVIYYQNKVLGKPQDEHDAFHMLKSLSNDRHVVYTGVAVITKHSIKITHDTSTVKFKAMSSDQIQAYVQTKEPLDKSGSYAIQGGAKAFIDWIDGDIETIIGLPSRIVMQLIKEVDL
jgi:septum formation protein